MTLLKGSNVIATRLTAKVMSQELLWDLRFFSAFYFAGNKKKKNQLTTQLAAIGRFNHGFFLFCLFIYYLNWDQTTVLSVCYLITRVGKIPLMIGHLLNDSLFSGQTKQPPRQEPPCDFSAIRYPQLELPTWPDPTRFGMQRHRERYV